MSLEGLFIILGLVYVVGVPAAIIYLLVVNSSLRRRLSELELAVLNRRTSVAPAEAQTTTKTSVPVVPDAKTPTKAAPEAKPDEPAKTHSKPIPASTEGPPKAVVLTKSRFDQLIAWLTQNWFYAVSAVSLALAGIFLVQYGIEQGLIPPWLRVALALLFGAALIIGGEYIRRRFGDGEDSATAYLPSTFSGAGIVTLFGAVLSARSLYGLIGPETALVGMAIAGVVALVLGWFNGPLLAAIGIIGAMAAPFLVGGESTNPSWLFLYFMIITLVGLAIDTVHRWAWVSMISLVMGYGAGLLLTMGAPSFTEPYFILFCAALAGLAIAIPVQKLFPDHDGTMISVALLAGKNRPSWPEFPTRLAGGAILASSLLIVLTAFDTSRSEVFWTAIITLTVVSMGLLIWARNADALTDLAALPVVAYVLVVIGGWRIWRQASQGALEPEADMPMLVSWLVCIGIILSAVAAWRSLRGGPAHVFLAAGAAITAPAIAIAIEMFWQPARILGTYIWGLHALAIAALMVGMAERFARADGEDDRLRMSIAVLSALASITFALVIFFSSAALTVSIVVTVVAAAWLDRQFNLPLMGLYILVGVAAVGYRLVADPGLIWASNAPLPHMLLSHGGAVLGMAAAWWLSREANRPRTEVLLESAVFSATGILASLLLLRGIESMAGTTHTDSHWAFGIWATIWIVLGLTQLRRLSMGGTLKYLRVALAVLFLVIGGLALLLTLSVFNPLLGIEHDPVLGPPFINTLLPAYILPAVAFAFGWRWLVDLSKSLRIAMLAAATALAAFWLGLTIRHFWRGGDAMELPGVTQPELYTYTLALLLIGAGLFYQSLARQNALLRKAGLAVIGLAVAKVFLIDISGLGGLIRVFSLLFLGLALAGLAWLNRWASGQAGDAQEDT